MRVLMLVIRYDVDNWATSFIPVWVTKLAAHVAHVDVLALEVGTTGDLPPNVRVFSMGKAPGVGRLRVLAGFYRHARQLMPVCDVVFAHMIPRYALLAAPLAVPQRKPLTLWYTHRNPSRDLRLALPLVRRVLTAVESSFPLKSDKVRAVGHGIDVEFFTPTAGNEGVIVVHVARIQPIKRQDVLLRALPHLPNAHAVFIGAVPEGEDRTYYESLHTLAAELGIADRVTFAGGLPAEDVRDWYRCAAAAVNLSPPGLFDKAPLESMAVGVPTLVSNPAFDDLLGAWRDVLHTPVEPGPLAAKLEQLLILPPKERAAIGRTLRANVTAAHSLDALIPRIAAALWETVR